MIFFARQPIFTVSGALYGYELLFRDECHLCQAHIKDQSQATSEVIVDGIASASSHTAQGIKIFINIPEALLHTSIAESISPEHCVLEILESVPATENNLSALRQLKNKGYTLALDDYSGQPELRPFLDCTDVVKVDFQATPPQDLAAVSEELRQRGSLMLAEKVETCEQAQWAAKAGYQLLQGFYFQRPELLCGMRMTPDAPTRQKLEQFLASSSTNGEDLSRLFAHSPQLAFRLLNFVNSAALSPDRAVDSIQEAVRLMGPQRLHHWLGALLIADQTYPCDTMRELSRIGIFRAHFLYALASFVHNPQAEQLFSLGLFSTLEAIYHTSFEQLFQAAGINKDVKQALVEHKGIFYPWLKTALLLENGDVEEARRLLDTLGIQDFRSVISLYRQALDQAGHFFQPAKS